MTTDRLGIDVLETDTCLELLRRSEVGRLAVSITDHPDIFPVNFIVDRGTIVIRTAEGTKLAAAVLGRAVAFEVDGYDADSGDAWSVVLKGGAVEIDQMEERFDVLDLPLFPLALGTQAPLRADRAARDQRTPFPRRRRPSVGWAATSRRPCERGVIMSEAARPAELFELDRPTCLALLTTQHVGRLIIDAAAPVIRVINYTAVEHTIMFRSDPGPQIDDIVDAPVVFEADMFDDQTRSGWSVVVRGVARDLSSNLAGLGQSGVTVDPWAPGPKNRWFAITIDDVTGRLLRGEVRPTWVNPQGYL